MVHLWNVSRSVCSYLFCKYVELNMEKNKAQWFFDLTGELPEDFFGPDWENALEDWIQEKEIEARNRISDSPEN